MSEARVPDAPPSRLAPQPKPRIAWIDTGRGIAILLVVLYHAANWLDVPGWQAVNTVVASLRMPLFFAMSGLFAHKWVVAPWPALWRSKISLYAWVFLVWEAIGSAVFLLGLTMQSVPFGLRGTLRDLALSPLAPRFELWFIWALAIFYVVAKLTVRMDRRLQLAVAAVASVVALSGLDLGNIGWNGLLRYYAFFLVGLHLREELMGWGARARRSTLAAVLGAWALWSLTLTVLDLRDVPGLYFLNCVLGLFGGVALSRALVRVRLLGRLGRQTLPIYLAHTPLVILLAFAVQAVAGDPSPGASALVAPPLAAASVIWLALALHRWAVDHRLGWLYAPPRWFAVARQRQPAVAH